MYKKIILASTILATTGCVQPQEPTIQRPLTLSQQTIISKTLLEQIRELENSGDIQVNVSMPSSLRVGKFLNLTASPSVDGYLNLVVINPNDKVEFVLPNRYDSGFIRANSSLHTDHKDFGIQTFPPKGMHHILVLFTQKKPPSNYAVIQLLQDAKRGRFGRWYSKLFALDIH
jgi:hypothetical protein